MYFSLFVCLLATAFCVGCDSGGDDDDGDAVAATETNSAAPVVEATTQVLGSGDVALIAAGPVASMGPYTAPGDGSIMAQISWSEGTQITAYFKKSGPANFGWVQGASTLTSTADPVSKDETVTLYLLNSGGVNAAAHFTVTYIP